LVRELATVDGLDVQGLYTHFATADEPDQMFAVAQLACFQHWARQLEEAGYLFSIQHTANSAATFAMRASHCNLVRVGLGLYGVSPSGTIPAGLSIRPAVSLKARIARLLTLQPGEGIGYGQTWRAAHPTRVALVTAGYADGIPRSLSNRGKALVKGSNVPVVGRVSMDLTTLDVTGCSNVSVGDVVTFLGIDASSEISLAQFAESMGTIPHEALTLIGGRVARIYREDGAIVRVTRLSGTVDIPV
jgi:alanine racemase